MLLPIWLSPGSKVVKISMPFRTIFEDMLLSAVVFPVLSIPSNTINKPLNILPFEDFINSFLSILM